MRFLMRVCDTESVACGGSIGQTEMESLHMLQPFAQCSTETTWPGLFHLGLVTLHGG